jgi:spermidine synthase
MGPRVEVLLIALGALAFELALTRVAAFLLQYHFAFLSVAAGIGAMGLGIALAAWRAGGPRARASAAAAAAVLMVATLVLPRLAAGSLSGVAAALALGATAAFVALGRALGLAFEAARDAPRAAYACDAAGAAAGTAVALAALEIAGPGAAVAAASASAIGAAGIAGRRALWLLGALVVPGAVVATPGADLAAPETPLGHRLRRGGRVIETRWDAYARTDLVAAPALKLEEIYADGTAPAMIVPGAGDPRVQAAHRRELVFAPFALRRPARVLSLGGGAGYDAWLARLGGAREVDVVELNRAALSLAQRPGTSADVLGAPGVRVYRDDGRRFLRLTTETYDLIVLALYQGQAEARASVALLEASGYTREAVSAYLDHLGPGGRVAVLLHDRVLLERLWRTVEAVLGDGRDRVLALEHSPSAPYRYLLYFGRDPWDAGERAAMAAARPFAALGRIAPAQADLAPTTDERPFFFHTEGTVPAALWWIAVPALGLAAALALRRGRAGVPAGARALALLSGAGFATLEILLVQRFLPALGLPVLSLGAVAVAMLAGSAAGALWARRVGAAPAAAGLALLAALVGGGGAAVWSLAAAPLGAAVAVVAAASAAAGLLAGRPLPAALEQAGGAPGAVARLWALASLSAVGASALLMALAMRWGYDVASLLPAGAYALLAVVAARAR